MAFFFFSQKRSFCFYLKYEKQIVWQQPSSLRASLGQSLNHHCMVLIVYNLLFLRFFLFVSFLSFLQKVSNLFFIPDDTLRKRICIW